MHISNRIPTVLFIFPSIRCRIFFRIFCQKIGSLSPGFTIMPISFLPQYKEGGVVNQSHTFIPTAPLRSHLQPRDTAQTQTANSGDPMAALRLRGNLGSLSFDWTRISFRLYLLHSNLDFLSAFNPVHLLLKNPIVR